MPVRMGRWAGAVHRTQSGLTLMELLLVMALIIPLLGLTAVSLLRPQTDASLEGIIATLTADIKSQQIRAMSGDGGSDGQAEPHGLFLEADRYTLFKDAVYTAGGGDNFVVSAGPGITISTTLPSSVLTFDRGSGEVAGFSAGANTITVSNGAGRSVTLTINRYGAITES